MGEARALHCAGLPSISTAPKRGDSRYIGLQCDVSSTPQCRPGQFLSTLSLRRVGPTCFVCSAPPS